MYVGQVLRSPQDRRPEDALIDGFPNFYHVTQTVGHPLVPFWKGINWIAPITIAGETRIPAIIIRSNPHASGSEQTPWQDFFDSDNGHIRYFGDNKTPGMGPEKASGNAILLRTFAAHSSLDPVVRRAAPPLVCFRVISVGDTAKSHVEFQGFGLIERAELVTELNRDRQPFANYVFDVAVLSLASEAETFSWDWISARRLSVNPDRALQLAPAAWREWVSHGVQALPRCRRRVSRLRTTKTDAQRPPAGSREAIVLQQVYAFYEGRKHRFEALAAAVAQEILDPRGDSYIAGWITPATSDGGSDFIGRLNLGSGFSTVKLVVLGQAKCEKPSTTTSGRDIARTVARLKRGWIGVYVTTSVVSEEVQREVIEDQYPILLVSGLRLATEVLAMMHRRGISDVRALLSDVDRSYSSLVASRRPEEILLQ